MLVANFKQIASKLGAFARIEPGGWLVETKQHRVRAHCASDLEAALGPVGEFAGRIVGTLAQASRAPSRWLSAPRVRTSEAPAPRARYIRRPTSADCAARPEGFPRPSCPGTAGYSGTCERRGRAA